MLYQQQKENHLGLFLDLYELTMTQGFFKRNPKQRAVFDAFIRKSPYFQDEGYILFAGLDPLLKALKDFCFSQPDIEYLKSLNLFSNDFLNFLSTFSFKGTLYSTYEGKIIFPNVPFLRMEGTLIELQLVEGLVLNTLNFQSLIATKSSRIVFGAGAKRVLEFGLRRAQGIDGALSATRASFIGGAEATSHTLAAKILDIPVKGTMAHSWIMSFSNERQAFEAYAKMYPSSCILLIDTYNTLKSGIVNAIPVLKSLKEQGYRGYGVRIDSGDLGYLSQEVRKQLDNSQLNEALITVSNDLDETIIASLLNSQTPIDIWGVGTNLSSGGKHSALSGVFKLSALENTEKSLFEDKMKITDNITKTSQPGIKNVMRFYDAKGFILADLIYLEEEQEELLDSIQLHKPIQFFHPFGLLTPWLLNEYEKAEILLNLVMKKGQISLPSYSLQDIQKQTQKSFSQLEPRYYRLVNPHIYRIGLSQNLFEKKESLLKKHIHH